MKILTTLKEQDIYPDAPELAISDFKKREAVRAVVIDAQGQIALLHVSKRGYHKLPGGGIEPGEDKIQALERELLEEIGSKVKIIGEIGEIHEYRDQWKQFQISYCYLAEQVGTQIETNLTEEEKADGFERMWAKDISQAIALLQADRPTNYDGVRVKARDLLLLQAAQEISQSIATH